MGNVIYVLNLRQLEAETSSATPSGEATVGQGG